LAQNLKHLFVVAGPDIMDFSSEIIHFTPDMTGSVGDPITTPDATPHRRVSGRSQTLQTRLPTRGMVRYDSIRNSGTYSKLENMTSPTNLKDVDDDEKSLLRKVLDGIDRLEEGQLRLEESFQLNNQAGRRGSYNSLQSGLAQAGSISPITPHRGERMNARHSFSSIDSAVESTQFFVQQTTMQWPASIAARYPRPAESSPHDDERLVVAISKMSLELHTLRHNTFKHSSGSFSEQGIRLPVLHPNSSGILMVDFIGCAVLLHDICVTPYILAWRAPVEGWLLATGLLAFLFWVCDSALGFCLAYYKDGELHQDQPAVAFHYLRRSFLIDFCILLVDALNLTLDSMQQIGVSLVSTDSATRLFRAFKLTRLLKLARAARVARLIDKMWVSETTATSSSSFVAALVAKILIVTAVANHILACLWYWQGMHGPSDTNLNWIEDSDLLEATSIYQYFVALHWSVAQMTLGASDAMPVNSYERFLNIIFLMNGLVFGSTTISYVSAAIVDYLVLQRDVTNQLLECRRFLRQFQCPSKLSAQVIKQLANRLSEEVPLKESEVAGLRLLAPTLRTQVSQATRIPHLEQLPLFSIWNEIDRRCIETLSATCCSHCFMSREDDLFQPGYDCSEAWHLIRGQLRYLQRPDTSKVVQSEVTIVEKGTWVSEASLWSFWSTVGSMEAHERSCHLLSVSSDGLVQMLQDFPLVLRLAQQYAKNFHACLTSAAPPHSSWPTDLHIPCTEDVAMLLSQHVGLGLMQRGLVSGRLELSDEDEAYLTKELMSGKCTLQYSEENGQLERVVGVANLMLKWDPTFDEERDSIRNSTHVLYQIGAMDVSTGKLRLALHMPGTKRWIGESPLYALKRMNMTDLGKFSQHMIMVDSERRVSVKESTQTLKMRTKTVKTIYRGILQEWPPDLLSTKVDFPRLQGLDKDLLQQDLLLLQMSSQVGFYAFLEPDDYYVLEQAQNNEIMRDWFASLNLEYCIV